MPRPIWSGAISFGLVNVPVKLFAAISPKDVRFHQLHGPDGARVQQRRICAADGDEVPYEEVVKGFEVAPDEYVPVTQEELDAIAPEVTRAIEIEEFVDLDEIDPMLYEHSYYLVPDRGAAKAYALLAQAMREANKVALGLVVLRTKQYLAAIRPVGEEALSLSTMVFADEVVPPGDVHPEGVEVPKREREMARSLVESLTAPFDPTRYHDEYREQLLAMIEQKAAGREIVQAEPEEQPVEVADLMAALEQSLAAARASDAADGGDGEDGEAAKGGRRRSTRRRAAAS